MIDHGISKPYPSSFSHTRLYLWMAVKKYRVKLVMEYLEDMVYQQLLGLGYPAPMQAMNSIKESGDFKEIKNELGGMGPETWCGPNK